MELERRVTGPDEASRQISGQNDEVTRLRARVEEMNKELERLRAVHTTREMTMVPGGSQNPQSVAAATTAQVETRQNNNRNVNCGGREHFSSVL